jgi:hypothetical protein
MLPLKFCGNSPPLYEPRYKGLVLFSIEAKEWLTLPMDTPLM